MNPPVIPINDQRQVQRRVTDHTPSDCHKLLNIQGVVDKIEIRLGDGSARMQRIEDQLMDDGKRMERIERSIDALANLQEKSAEFRDRLEKKLDDNTAMTSDIVDFSKSLSGFIRVVNWIGKFIGWAAGIAAPVLGLWYVLKDGVGKH